MFLRIDKFFFFLFFSLVWLSNVSSLFAGAWPREKHEVYSKLSLSQFESDEVYAPKKNKKLPAPDFTDVSTSFYGEYGFTSQWTGITSISYKSLESSTATVTQTESGFGDAWFYLKRGLVQSSYILSAQVGVKIPLGYDPDVVPPLGDGQVDLEGRLLFGKSFNRFPGYGGAEIAYRKRNGVYSDEIPYLLEAGVYPAKKILFKVMLDGISNLTNDKASDIGTTFGPNVFDEEYMKINPALIFFFQRGLAVEVGYSTYLSGANSSAGNTISVGLSWQGKVGRNDPE
jgi:protein XagA